ncbi:MAG: UMP kinase [Alphaproteobacteria bacterium]
MTIDFKNYKRILLKISGEAMMGSQKFGHDIEVIRRISRDIKEVVNMGIQVCLVVGGGNIFRGVSVSAAGMERASADYIGMLATVINALALQNSLEKEGIYTRVLSAIPMMTVCETYIRRRAVRHMQKGRVVIFAAGTGNPFFTTDTAATLRAVEMNCDAIFKGTQVDGVYTEDPKKSSSAVKYTELTYREVLNKELAVMDSSAIALAKDNNIPIIVFSIHKEKELGKVINNQGSYTLIKGEKNG